MDRPLFDAWTLDTVRHPALWPPADDSVMSPYSAAYELGWRPLSDGDGEAVAPGPHWVAAVRWDEDDEWEDYADAW